jgi:hypothetical protein
LTASPTEYTITTLTIRALAPWLAAAAAVALFASKALPPLALQPPCEPVFSQYADCGEALFHGVPGDVSGRMPGSTLAAVLLGLHSPLPCRWGPVLISFGLAALVLALGWSLPGVHPLGPPIALAALALAAPPDLFLALFVDTFFAGAVLVVAFAAARRAQKPDLARTVLLAVALGASIQIRSTLWLLPFVFAARELVRGRRETWRSAAVLALGPFVLLLPWVWLHWRLFHRFVPFEAGGIESNVVSAAFGLVQGIEGDWRALIGSQWREGSSVAWWAATRVARHPLLYAGGVARRLGLLFSWSPVLAAAAGVGVWRRRAGPFAELAVVAGYLVVVLCLMAIQSRYANALWPLFALLALGAWPGRSDAPRPRAGPALCGGALAALAGLAVFAQWKVLRYATFADWSRRHETERRLDEELARWPADPWLNAKNGKLRLAEGDCAAARSRFEAADAASPGSFQLEIAQSRMLCGEPRAVLDARPRPIPDDTAELRWALSRARAWIALGRRDEARRELDAAGAIYRDKFVLVRDGATGLAPQALARLRSPSGLLPIARWYASIGPAKDRRAFNALLLEAYPADDSLSGRLTDTAPSRTPIIVP